jgi:predicted nucleic acid-binding protein
VIVVDTTVWIDFFRGADTRQTALLRTLLGRGLILVGDIVLLEILQGVRGEGEAARVERALRSHRIDPMLSPETAPRVAANYRFLRSLGVTVRKTIDLIIGTHCIDGVHVLLHADRDFDPMERHLGLRVLR